MFRIRKNIISAAIICMAVLPVTATARGLQNGNDDNGLTYDIRLGYNLGGDAPTSLPNTIRHLNSYKIQPSIQLAIEGEKKLSDNWGLMSGIRLENKGMKTDARVKNYYMDITRGGQELDGMFTGDVTTKVRQWMLTLPVEATWHCTRNVRLHAGPYVSWVFSHHFTGFAHDGWLRVGNPTGAKVDLGHSASERGNYDFSDDMRHIQYGVGGGADWFVMDHFGIGAALSWGLTGVFHSSFKTVTFTMYPIFGNISLIYKM